MSTMLLYFCFIDKKENSLFEFSAAHFDNIFLQPLGWIISKRLSLSLFANFAGSHTFRFYHFSNFLNSWCSSTYLNTEKINDIFEIMLLFWWFSNQAIHISISKNQKNIHSLFFQNSCSFWVCEHIRIIRKIFWSWDIIENWFLLQLFVGFLYQNHLNWCILNSLPDLVIIAKLMDSRSQGHKNRKIWNR